MRHYSNLQYFQRLTRHEKLDFLFELVKQHIVIIVFFGLAISGFVNELMMKDGGSTIRTTYSNFLEALDRGQVVAVNLPNESLSRRIEFRTADDALHSVTVPIIDREFVRSLQEKNVEFGQAGASNALWRAFSVGVGMAVPFTFFFYRRAP